ncbi:MAG: hypothetical protein H6Q37_71 [Chloroflexi bacterium]|nr:hypothetical protein [Chloroflexota bacterium]
MTKMMINCPNCRRPITADIEQLFDVNVDPSAKQRLLSGATNQIQCPLCGYRGIYPTILVYHDPGKELLLTFAPPEMGLPRNEQERITGSLINQVINNLPMEKRKGYLFSPQAAFTLQGMFERILEADGITREMIQAQQQRLNLIQRLLSASTSEIRAELAKQEDALIDATFFSLLRRLMESAALSGDKAAAQELDQLEQDILPHTTFGRELQAQTQDVEAAVKDLQAAGKELTREKLLDLVVHGPNENYQRAMVSLARGGMDYQFFQLLSERIDRARGDGRDRLIELREKLLAWTQQIDKQIEEHSKEVRQLVTAILESDDIPEAMEQSLPYIDEFFVQELNRSMQEARSKGDLEKIGKFQKMVEVLQKASQPAAGVSLIEELLDVPEDENQKEAWREILAEHSEEVNPDFINAVANITAQVQDSDDQQMAVRLKELNRTVLRFSMEKNLKEA